MNVQDTDTDVASWRWLSAVANFRPQPGTKIAAFGRAITGWIDNTSSVMWVTVTVAVMVAVGAVLWAAAASWLLISVYVTLTGMITWTVRRQRRTTAVVITTAIVVWLAVDVSWLFSGAAGLTVDPADGMWMYAAVAVLTGIAAIRTSHGRAWVTVVVAAGGALFVSPWLLVWFPAGGWLWPAAASAVVVIVRSRAVYYVWLRRRQVTVPLASIGYAPQVKLRRAARQQVRHAFKGHGGWSDPVLQALVWFNRTTGQVHTADMLAVSSAGVVVVNYTTVTPADVTRTFQRTTNAELVAAPITAATVAARYRLTDRQVWLVLVTAADLPQPIWLDSNDPLRNPYVVTSAATLPDVLNNLPKNMSPKKTFTVSEQVTQTVTRERTSAPSVTLISVKGPPAADS